MTEENQNPITTDAGERTLLLAQANIPQGNPAIASEGPAVPVSAAQAAQSAFSEAVSSGKDVPNAITIAVEQARNEALAQGLNAQQADSVASRVRQELGTRYIGIQNPENVQTRPAGGSNVQGVTQGSTTVRTGVTDAAAGSTTVTPSAPPSTSNSQGQNAAAAALTPLAPVTSVSPASQANLIAPAVNSNEVAGALPVVDSGGGVGSSALGALSRAVSSQVGVDSGGSLNVTGLIAPYLKQQISTSGGLVSAMTEKADVKITSAGGGDPQTVQASLSQIGSIKAALSVVGTGSVTPPLADAKPALPASATTAPTQLAPIRTPPALDIKADAPTAIEGHQGLLEVKFVVTRTGDLSETDRVDWAATGVNAADLAAGALDKGTLVFKPTVATMEIIIKIAANTLVEADRLINVKLSNAINARLGVVTEDATLVLNDDLQYSIARSSDQADQVLEAGDANGIPVVFTVTRIGYLANAGTVHFDVSGMSADDFVNGQLPSGDLSFAPNQTSATLTLYVKADTVIETNESLVVTLSSPLYPATLGVNTSTVVIENDDVRFDIARAIGQAANTLEGTAGSGVTDIVFEVTKTGDVSTGRTVNYAVTGLAAADFEGGVIPSGTVSFAANQTSQLITLHIKPDALVEADESLVMTLSQGSNAATLGTAAATVVVANDDVRFDIALGTGQSAQVLEGTAVSGGTPVVFWVTKTGDVSSARTVQYTANGLAAADFAANEIPSGTLTFAANQTSLAITLMVKPDALVEADETLAVSLSSPSNGATLGNDVQSVVIENDDVSFSLVADASSVLEGTVTGGSTPVVFTVTKLGVVASSRTVDYAASGLTANDFTSAQVPSGTLTFSANEASKKITLMVAADATTGEGDENLLLTLSNPNLGGTVAPGAATASTLVYNDDLTVSVSAVQSSVLETDSGADALMVFKITRTEALNERAVSWGLSLNGLVDTALSLFPGYSGTVNFAAGQTEAFVTIRVPGNDLVDTGVRSAVMTLSNPTHGMQMGQSTQTINLVDNDVFFAIQADQSGRLEGYAGQTTANTLVFTISREAAGTATDTVQWRVAPSSAANPADFVSGQDLLSNAGLPSGTVTFTGAQTSVKLTLNIAGDDWFGADEAVLLALSNPSRGKVTTATAQSLIQNDDAPYSVQVVGASNQLEGSGAAGAQFVFEVTRPAGSALDARSLLWSVQSTGVLDAAVSPNDFLNGSNSLPSGTVSFAAGATSVWVTLSMAPDSRVEGSESFVLAIADAAETQNTTIAVPLSAPVTIRDDDASYRIDATNAIFLEGSASGASQAFVFTVSREGYLDNAASVNWQVETTQGDTVNAADFAAGQNQSGLSNQLPTGLVSFTAGQSQALVTVLISADAQYEPNESFAVRISAANEAGMSFSQRTATGLVLNDEIGLRAVAVDASKPEGDTGTTSLVFNVERLGVIQSTSAVDWELIPAANGPDATNDFAAGQNALSGHTFPSGSLTFSVGEASRLVTVLVQTDTALEGNESFAFKLSNASLGSEIVVESVSGTIVNDDAEIQMDPVTTPEAINEGNAGTKPFVVTVLREGSTVGTDTVAWALTATGAHPVNFPADLSSATAGTLTFSNGQSAVNLTMTLVADSVEELSETFTLTLGATSLGTSLKTGGLLSREFTLTNDDSTLSLTTVTGSADEGSPGAGGVLVYQITRTGALDAGSVNYSVTAAAAPAVTGSDFASTPNLPAGTVSFTAGQSAADLTIALNGDYNNEADENLTVTLSSPSAGQLIASGQSPASGVIRNDDTGLSVSATASNLAEGSVAGQYSEHVFTVTRSGIVTGETTVAYTVSGLGAAGVAADAADFRTGVLPTGTITFAPSQTLSTVTVYVNQDQDVENNETYRLTLSNASGNADIQVASADGTILSDDAGLSVAANAASVSEGTSGSQFVYFTVTRSGDLSQTTTVDWTRASSGTVVDSADLTSNLTAGTVTFAPGASTQQVVFSVKGDTTLEPNELLQIQLSNPSAGAFLLSSTTASTSILNDDDSLSLQASALTVTEGGAGVSTPIVFNILRDASGILRSGTVVEWTFQSSMANSKDFDLVAGLSPDALGTNNGLPSGSVTFSAGQTAIPLTVFVHGDSSVERNETYSIGIATPTANTALSVASLNGQITNDDFGFSIGADQTALNEGVTVLNGTTTGTGSTLVFTVTRAGAVGDTAAVTYSVTAGGTLAGSDLVGGLPSTTDLTFTSGELQKQITLTLAGDTTVESDETLILGLSNSRNLTTPSSPPSIVDAALTLVVLNDDQSFAAQVVGGSSINEGASGTTPIVFEVLRSGLKTGTSVVSYVLSGGAGVDANDYVGSLPSGDLTFDAGVTSQLVTLLIKGDNLGEANEAYTLTLSSPTEGTLGTTAATITVNNDDTNYVLSSVPSNGLEGSGGGSTPFVFTIQRTGKTDATGSVAWSITANGTDSLTAADFTGGTVPSGTASFIANQTTALVTILVAKDALLEQDEGMVMRLASPVGGTLEAGTTTVATVFIQSDDDEFSIARVTGASVLEGNTSTQDLVFTVTRDGALRGSREVNYTASGTGITAGDFIAGTSLTGTLTFADSQTSQNITLKLQGDSSVENDEVLAMTLSAPSGGATLKTGASAASLTIANDDALLVIAAANPTQLEGNTFQGVLQSTDVVFNITRSNYINQVTTVTYGVAGVGGTLAATSDDFYSNSFPSGVLTFSVNESATLQITLRVKADSVKEDNETFAVTLSNASAGSEISTASATQTIQNDDAEYALTSSAASVTEGDAGHSTGAAFVYTVTRSGYTSAATSVDWQVAAASGSTVSAADFTTGTQYFASSAFPNGSLNFTVGQSTATFTVYAYGDTGYGSVEGNEPFTVQISNPSDGSSVGAQNSYASTIVDNDTLVTVSVSDYSQAESIAGVNTNFVYTITRTGNLSNSSVVSYAVGNTDPRYPATTVQILDNIQNRWEINPVDGTDFVGGSLPSGNVTLAANVSVQQFTVTVAGDNNPEDDQWFVVNLSGSGFDQMNVLYDDPNLATGTQLFRAGYNVPAINFADGTTYTSPATGMGTAAQNYIYSSIERDEAIFSINGTSEFKDSSNLALGQWAWATRKEGDTVADGGTVASIDHVYKIDRTISQSGNAWVTWRVDAYTSSGYHAPDASDFAAGSDARSVGALASGTLSFTNGQSYGLITITTKTDNVGEFDEAFKVYLDAVSAGSSIDAADTGNDLQGVNAGFLMNDDTRFDIGSNNVVEGGKLVFTITRAGDSRGTDIAEWGFAFPGAESTNESNATSSTWYKLDPNDVGADLNARLANITQSDGSLSYNSGNSTFYGQVIFLDGETTKTVTIQTIDDNFTETWREELPTFINATNTRNVTGSLFGLSGTFVASDQVSANVAGTLVSYTVLASDVTDGGATATAYQNILTGLKNVINTNVTTAAASTASLFQTTLGPQLLVEKDTASPGGAFSVVPGVTQAAGSSGVASVLSEVNSDAETASPGYTDVAWVLDNESDPMVTVSANTGSIFEGTGASNNAAGNAVVFTLTRNDSALLGGALNYATTVGWKLSGIGSNSVNEETTTLMANSVSGTGTSVTVWNTSDIYDPSSIYGLTTFSAGQTSALVTLVVDGDNYVENDHNYVLSLQDASTVLSNSTDLAGSHYWNNNDGYGTTNVDTNLATSKASFTVRNDDVRLWVSGWDTYSGDGYGTYMYGFESAAPVITLIRGGRLDNTVLVNYSVSNGDTTVADFTTSSGTLTLSASATTFGQTTYTFTLASFFNDDSAAENTEWFTLNLSAPADSSGASVRFHSYYLGYDGYSGAPTSSLAVNGYVYDDDTTYVWSWGDSSQPEGNGGTSQYTSFVATLSRTAGYVGPAQVNWSLAPTGNVVDATDFYGGTLPTGSLNFTSGQTAATVTVYVRQDAVVESNESFVLRLNGATYTAGAVQGTKVLSFDSPTATIENDDTGLSVSNASVTEVDDGATSNMVFTLTRTGFISEATTIGWTTETTGGAGSANSFDFVAASGSVNFTSGQATALVTVVIQGDNAAESDETFNLRVTSYPTIEELTDLVGVGTILNDDASFAIAATNAITAENVGNPTFTITRSNATVQNQVINWAVTASNSGDTVVAADFSPTGLPQGAVTFTGSELSKVVTLAINNDATFEFDETYELGITLGTGTTNDTITTASAQGKIVNDDSAFSITVDQANRAEGNNATQDVVFSVNRVGALSGTSTVQLTTSSQLNASDVTGSLPSNQTLTFAANVSVQTFTIVVNGDSTLETDESLVLTLSNPTGAGLVAAAGVTSLSSTVTITNDDAEFSLSLTSGLASAAEGSGTSRELVYTVTRGGYLDSSGAVNYAVTSLTGTVDANDFLSGSSSGTVNFGLSATAATFTLKIAADSQVELDEVFRVDLNTSTPGFTIKSGLGSSTVTLVNDDTRFDLSAVGSTTVTEVDPTSTPNYTPVVFQIDRAGLKSGSQTVQWTITGSGDDPASPVDDFVAATGNVTFAAGSTNSELFTVQVKGDLLGEPNEGFTVALSGAGLNFGTQQVTTGLIIDDEASLSIRRPTNNGAPIDDAYEGNSGAATYVFNVFRSGNIASGPSTVDWKVIAGGGVDVNDFVSSQDILNTNAGLPSGHVSFAAGETLVAVTVQVQGDTLVEASEVLTVALSNPSSDADIVSAYASATAMIRSEDTRWTLVAVSSPSVESDTTANYVYKVVREGGLDSASIDYSVGVLSGEAAANDFVSGILPTGSLNFTAGQLTSAPFTVQVAGDSQLEPNELFTVTLGDPLADGLTHTYEYVSRTVTSTIVNDDDVIGIAATNTSLTEGDTGSQAAVFTLTRTGSLVGNSTMGWRIPNATTAGVANAADFVTASGTVTFSNGESTVLLTVNVKGDLTVEDDETYSVVLENPGAGSTIDGAASSAAGSIANNDVGLAISADVGSVDEGDTSSGLLRFAVTRSGDLTVSTSVNYAVTGTGAHAVAVNDFAPGQHNGGAGLPSGSLQFSAGQSLQYITMTTAPDGDFEFDETLTVTLSGASGNTQILTATATGTIQNDDDQLALVAVSANQAEGTGSGYTDFVFAINRTGSAVGGASVEWTAAGSGTKPLGNDEFLSLNGVATFSDGQTVAYVTVGVLADTLGEYAETFQVSLANPSLGSTIIDATETGTVQNDDPVLSITSNQVSKAEGNTNAADTAFVFTVTRTGSTVGASLADWSVSPTSGQTVNPIDFGGYLPSGTVVFTNGQVTQTLTVMVLADQMGELNEDFAVTLSNPVGADILDERVATTTIVNDDTLVSVQAAQSSVVEGVAGASTPVVFTFTREGNISMASTVEWRVEGVGTAQPTALDFVTGQDALSNVEGLPSGTVSFSATQSTLQLTLLVQGDAQVSADESFKVQLSNPSVGAMRLDSASVTIQNDDAMIALQSAAQVVNEGNQLVYTLTRSGTALALSSEVSVQWAVSGYGENATSNADFSSAVTGTVTFAPNATAASITLAVAADSLVEGGEGFMLQLTGVPSGNASLNPTSFAAQGTVTDDDVGVWVTSTQASVIEGSASGTTPFVVSVNRAGRTDLATSLNLVIAGTGISPTDSQDFAATSVAVTFAASQTQQYVTLGIVQDAQGESDERFVVSIANGAGHTVIGEPVYGQILNDDATTGNDVIYGTAGNDVLYGGAGNDTLFGGGGNDRFIYQAPNEGVDAIMDYSASDVIQFNSTAFGGLNINTTTSVTGTLDEILAKLSTGDAKGDADFFKVDVSGQFQFATGVTNDLGKLEKAITDGNATGPGFVAVSDGVGPVHLYFDANMASGNDGTGLQEIAVLHSVTSTTPVNLTHIS